jgi:hypothetical protein
MEVTSTLPLIVGQYGEVVEIMGVDHEHMVAIVSYVVDVWTAGDIMTFMASVTTCECPIN